VVPTLADRAEKGAVLKPNDTYDRGAELTFQIVGAYKIRAPRFRFPHPEIALIASIADVGDKLCVNPAARDLVAFLMAECDRQKLGDYPTVMMLRASLEMHRIDVDYVPIEDLNIVAGGMSPLPRGRN